MADAGIATAAAISVNILSVDRIITEPLKQAKRMKSRSRVDAASALT
jgi:hypothetical protein